MAKQRRGSSSGGGTRVSACDTHQPRSSRCPPTRFPALTIQVSALSSFAPCEKAAARVVLRPPFSRSPTRSCGPPSGQWSKPAGTRRCAQCSVSHWGDTPGKEARRQEQTAALTQPRPTSSKKPSGYDSWWTSRGGVEEGGGALGSSQNACTRGRSSTSTSHTLLPSAPRRSANV
jgi:hypothetical protein